MITTARHRHPTLVRVPGLQEAATRLRRYRSTRSGTPPHVVEDVLTLDAEDANRTYFESRTFVATSGHRDIDRRLIELSDGAIFDFADHFDWPFGGLGPSSRPRHTGVRSSGGFTARREGNELLIDGTVRHGFYTNAAEPSPSGPVRPTYNRRQNVLAESCYEARGELTLMRVIWGDVY